MQAGRRGQLFKKLSIQGELAMLDIMEVLDHIWLTLCNTHDACADLPAASILFDGIDLDCPEDAAERVLTNMLSEIIDDVNRFSPWYKKSAADFGLLFIKEQDQPIRWILSPEAKCRWAPLLNSLTVTIQKNVGFIRANSLLDDLIPDPAATESCVLASCLCVPPRMILVK